MIMNEIFLKTIKKDKQFINIIDISTSSEEMMQYKLALLWSIDD